MASTWKLSWPIHLVLRPSSSIKWKSCFVNHILPSTLWIWLEEKIKFSPPSAHSKCTICFALKSKIRHAKGIAEQTDASDKLLRHLAGQYADRAVYRELRNRAKTTGDIICCITDSMDKSKFSLPRYQRGQAPKDVATVDRPSLEVTITLVHGVGVFTHLGDENQTAGTNWVLETLTRSLQHTWIFFRNNRSHNLGFWRYSQTIHPKNLCLAWSLFFLCLYVVYCLELLDDSGHISYLVLIPLD